MFLYFQEEYLAKKEEKKKSVELKIRVEALERENLWLEQEPARVENQWQQADCLRQKAEDRAKEAEKKLRQVSLCVNKLEKEKDAKMLVVDVDLSHMMTVEESGMMSINLLGILLHLFNKWLSGWSYFWAKLFYYECYFIWSFL